MMAMAKREMTVSELARLGGKARAAQLTEEERRELGRKGMRARWTGKSHADRLRETEPGREAAAKARKYKRDKVVTSPPKKKKKSQKTT